MLQKELAELVGVNRATFSMWWNNGAQGGGAIKAAKLLSLYWTRDTRGEEVDTHICPSDLVSRAGFRRQVRKICPEINEGRGRVKKCR